MLGDVIVYASARKCTEENDQREDRKQERRTEEDDPVAEFDLAERMDQVLDGRSVVAIPPTLRERCRPSPSSFRTILRISGICQGPPGIPMWLREVLLRRSRWG